MICAIAGRLNYLLLLLLYAMTVTSPATLEQCGYFLAGAAGRCGRWLGVHHVERFGNASLRVKWLISKFDCFGACYLCSCVRGGCIRLCSLLDTRLFIVCRLSVVCCCAVCACAGVCAVMHTKDMIYLCRGYCARAALKRPHIRSLVCGISIAA